MRKYFLIFIAGLAIGGAVYFLARRSSGTASKSLPSGMPPVVGDSMADLLHSLEIELQKHQPDILASLQPGIEDRELERAETLLGRSIHPEMKELYRWHNGLGSDKELFPGFGFFSLEDAIQTNQGLTRQYKEKGVDLMMAHEENWLTLFPDPAGDGYYYDPSRNYESGGVFYNFRESGSYRIFPSIRNLLKAVLECFQAGAYPPDSEPDFALEEQIMDQYDLAVEGQ